MGRAGFVRGDPRSKVRPAWHAKETKREEPLY